MTAAAAPASVTCSKVVHSWPFHVKVDDLCLCKVKRYVPRQPRPAR